tara:strand:+ start:694 stop:1335 length:642 start_codon:yes stop_codon:yes gene_type:complete
MRRREMNKIICVDCGNGDEVPFKPDEDRPVYCKECFQKHRTSPQNTKRVLDLESELETLKVEFEKSKKDYSYLYADFDNYKKLKEQDLLNAKMKSRVDVIKHLIELYEDINRVVKNSKDFENLSESIETVILKLEQIFKFESVEPIEVKTGEKFDPSLHRVVEEISTDDYGDNIICKEIKKGYKISGNVFQFSEVAVSQSESNTKEENVNVRN